MKSTAILFLVGGALAAPTRTLENRQFGDIGSSSGLGALSSLIPSLGSGSSSSSGLGALSSLIPSMSSLGSSSGGSSSSSGLGALSSALGGSSSSGGLSLPSFSNIPSIGDIGSLGGNTKRQTLGGSSSSITANGITDGDSCQLLTFIFARGSDEVGNMGSVVGPEVATQLKSLLDNKVVVQGVTYTASAGSNVELGANGGPIMANLVEKALKQCPNTKVVLGGYSQGAMVTHNAANRLSANQVAAAVLFGDPFKTQSVGKLSSSDVKEFCATGDPVCENGVNVLAHLSYGSDAKEAAQFLVKAAGVSTSS